jgi:hypothetical protein
MNKSKIYDSNFSQLLLQHISYDESSSTYLRWIKRTGFKISVGDEAFTATSANGYKTGRFLGEQLYAHRVVWFIVFGEWPRNQIDHLDGNRCNNRKENLRSVTQSVNSKNMRMLKTNSSGFTGVHYCNKDRRFYAGYCVNNKRINVPCDGGLLDAVASLMQARRRNGVFTDRHGT